jgi:hypothetical protein
VSYVDMLIFSEQYVECRERERERERERFSSLSK